MFINACRLCGRSLKHMDFELLPSPCDSNQQTIDNPYCIAQIRFAFANMGDLCARIELTIGANEILKIGRAHV